MLWKTRPRSLAGNIRVKELISDLFDISWSSLTSLGSSTPFFGVSVNEQTKKAEIRPLQLGDVSGHGGLSPRNTVRAPLLGIFKPRTGWNAKEATKRTSLALASRSEGENCYMRPKYFLHPSNVCASPCPGG